MSSANPRRIAVQILEDIHVNGAYSNISINRFCDESDLSYDQKRFVRELVLGVIENRMLLDYQIEFYSSIRLKKINSFILNVLRLGAYQILFLDRVPASAAVDESVKLTKKRHQKSSGFVNGILRSIARNEESIRLPNKDESAVRHLSVRFSHPEWIVERWMGRFGEKFTFDLLKANNEMPRLNIRPNLLKTTREKLESDMEGMGISFERSVISRNSIRITGMKDSIFSSELFKSGMMVVQDEAASLSVEILDPKPGEAVLDMCAAPGGKTFYAAELMENRGRLVSRDIYGHKIDLMERTGRNLGISIAEFEKWDGLELDEKSIGVFDKVIIDAPCSGLGIIRRKPEIKYNRKMDDISELSEIQLKLLTNGSKYLKPGGELVYSTCTTEQEENRGVIERFMMAEGDRFELVDARSFLGDERLKGDDMTIQLYPNVHGSDGFFISKIRRVR